MNKSEIKTIAFYLPKFHAIPENDKTHGKGVTEWTNTKNQSLSPLDKKYYCLLDEGVMEKQAKLAKSTAYMAFAIITIGLREGRSYWKSHWK